MIKVATIALALLTAGSVVSAAIVTDFDGYADNNALKADYDNNNAALVSSGGIDNSQYMKSSSGTTGWYGTWTTSTFDASSVGSQLAVSVYLLADAEVQKGSTNTANDRSFRIGFYETGDDGQDYVEIKIGSTGHDGYELSDPNDPDSDKIWNADYSEWKIWARADASKNTQDASTDSFEVLHDHWYKLDAVFELTSSTTWDVNMTLTDYGTDGLLGANPATATLSDTLTLGEDASLGSAAVLGMRLAENDRTGINGYDNLSAVIPEPATMAILGLGGLAVLRRRGNG